MALSSTDTDGGPLTEEEVAEASAGTSQDINSELEDMEDSKRENEKNTPQYKAAMRERREERTETRSESIQGLDNLNLAVNSLDDHLQAGLQEVRNCIATLSCEKRELLKQVRSLTETVEQVTAQRDHQHQVMEELQMEVVKLREQLHVEEKEKETLSRKLQDVEEQEEQHLQNIARTARNRRLAHSSIVKWRRKVLEKNRSGTFQVHVLEEENSRLRAELLLCQEAAKQAFLRSANVLNSEAITMFQDAATRRLGSNEDGSQERASSPESTSSSSSSAAQPHNTQAKSASMEAAMDKENIRGDANRRDKAGEGPGWGTGEAHHTHTPWAPKQCDRNTLYSSTFQDGNREYRTSHMSSTFPRSTQRHDDNYEQTLECGSFSHYVRKQPRGRSGYPESQYVKGTSSARQRESVTGAVPKTKPMMSEIAPDSLRQETRAYLQQLQDGRFVMPEASSFEPQRKTQRTAPTHQSVSSKNSCTCKFHYTSVPYKCPYCTPVQNSNFGHIKDPPKKSANAEAQNKVGASNVARSTMLSAANVDKKKVKYDPTACTVLIEKHITK